MKLFSTRHGRNILTVAATALCAAMVLSSTDLAIGCLGGLPLVLYLPGTALVSAVDPFGHQLWGVPRHLWSVGASIGSLILGGFLLNVTGGLTTDHWVALVAIGVVVLCGVSSLRVVFTRSKRTDVPMLVPDLDDGEGGGAQTVSVGSWALPRVGVSYRQWVLLIVAVGIALGTVAISQHSVAVSSREPFVQAWILPQPVADPWSREALIGVRNMTGSTQTVLVDATLTRRAGGTPTNFNWTTKLAPGASWTRRLARETGEPVRVKVALAQAPTIVVSTVNLANPAH